MRRMFDSNVSTSRSNAGVGSSSMVILHWAAAADVSGLCRERFAVRLSTRTNARGILNEANAARQRCFERLEIEVGRADDIGDRNLASDRVGHSGDRGFGDLLLFQTGTPRSRGDRC